VGDDERLRPNNFFVIVVIRRRVLRVRKASDAHRGLDRFSRRALTGAKTTVGLWTLFHNGHLWLRKKTQNEITKKSNSPPHGFVT